MRESVGVWNNANTWVIIEWYLRVAGYVFLLIVGVCLWCAWSLSCKLRSRPASKFYPICSCVRFFGFSYAAFDRGFLKNYVLHCYGFVLHTGSPVRCILPLHCFIVMLDPVLFACEGKCNCMVADCGKANVGQTDRNFATRFREHKNGFGTASRSSNFAKHLIEHTHSFGPIHSIMQILQLQNKRTHLNTLEPFHIYTEYTSNNHLNDDITVSPNKIFDTLVKPPHS